MAKKRAASGDNLGFEAKPWLTADKLFNNMDAFEHKFVILGLISNAFKSRYQKLLAEMSEWDAPEDTVEYRAENVFWVPQEARWQHLQHNAKQPPVGKLTDKAMVAVKRELRPVQRLSSANDRLESPLKTPPWIPPRC